MKYRVIFQSSAVMGSPMGENRDCEIWRGNNPGEYRGPLGANNDGYSDILYLMQRLDNGKWIDVTTMYINGKQRDIENMKTRQTVQVSDYGTPEDFEDMVLPVVFLGDGMGYFDPYTGEFEHITESEVL